MWTKRFWKDAAERGLKSAAQALILVWPLGDGVFNAWEIDLAQAGGISVGALVLSLLTSVLSSGIGAQGTASMVDDVTYTRP